MSTIREIKNKLAQHGRENPIDQGDFLAWRENPVTKRLLEELSIGILEEISDLPSLQEDAREKAALKMAVTNEFLELINNWKPQSLKRDS